LPHFLEILKTHCKIHHLHSTTDYRTVQYENSANAGVFSWPPDQNFIDQWFHTVTNGLGGSRANVDVSYGRSMEVSHLSNCGKIARFPFEDLIQTHLSADDYSVLCRQFHTILIDNIPCFSVDDHNEVRRFTSFIDNCYEYHTRLICSMGGPPEAILGEVSTLRDISISSLGGGVIGSGDDDISYTSSGVLHAIDRIKAGMVERHGSGSDSMHNTATARPVLAHEAAINVLGGQIKRIQAQGGRDMAIWRQERGSSSLGHGGRRAPPQVTRVWDDLRRLSQFTWESTDPTAEAQAIKGVYSAAVTSLKESGFAVDRAISRLQEMQTEAYQREHKLKHLLD